MGFFCCVLVPALKSVQLCVTALLGGISFMAKSTCGDSQACYISWTLIAIAIAGFIIWKKFLEPKFSLKSVSKVIENDVNDRCCAKDTVESNVENEAKKDK